MPYRKIIIEASSCGPQQVEDALFSCGALSVTLEDAADDPILEPGPGEIALWPATRLSALFPSECDPDSLRQALCTALGVERLPDHALEWLEDRVWERVWLDDFHPMRFGTRLWICPGDGHADEPGAIEVRLDPGLAFGTGTHPSTAACLEWLDANPPHGQRVLDYGCGSGILAIAALRLGAARATALDIDPQALLATRDNAQRNGVERRVACIEPAQLASLRYDLVIANILAAPLVRLASHLAALASPGAGLLLAGLLAEQAAEVAQAYQPWFDIESPRIFGEWASLSGRRRAD